MKATFVLLVMSFPFTIEGLAVSLANGVVTPTFSDSVLLSLPSCVEYGDKIVTLQYSSAKSSQNLSFTVPACQKSDSATKGLITTGGVNVYQVKNLMSGTEYSFQYILGNVSSDIINTTTLTALDYNGIDTGLPARSGAMVVITVILSVAMFILLAGLIASVILAPGDD